MVIANSPSSRARARACLCPSATTRPELGRSGSGGGTVAPTQRRRRRGTQNTTRALRRLGASPARRSLRLSLARDATAALRGVMAVGDPGPAGSGAPRVARASLPAVAVMCHLALRYAAVWILLGNLRIPPPTHHVPIRRCWNSALGD